MSGSPAHDRRARTPRQELLGSTLSALMALQFAVVVMFGKEVAAGELPFPMLAIRFAGQAVLLFVVLLLLRKPLRAGAGGARCRSSSRRRSATGPRRRCSSPR